MPSRQRLGYRHKSGTGHHSKKRRTTPISAIPGRPYSNSNGLVDHHLPPPSISLPVTDAIPVIADNDPPRVVPKPLESSPSTSHNANGVHFNISSISSSPPISQLNHPLVVLTPFESSVTTGLPSNSGLSTLSSSSRSNPNFMSNHPVVEPTPLESSRTSTVRNVNETTSDLQQVRTFISSSATNTALSNYSPTSLCNYKRLLQEHMNLVNSKLDGSSVMSPPVSIVETANQSTVSSIRCEASQVGQVASTSSQRSESTNGSSHSDMPHVLQDAAPTPQNLANVFSAADST